MKPQLPQAQPSTVKPVPASKEPSFRSIAKTTFAGSAFPRPIHVFWPHMAQLVRAPAASSRSMNASYSTPSSNQWIAMRR
jgi:hypothetical protein